jgi:hypothetical protein
MKFEIGDICIAKDKNWLISIKGKLFVNTFKIVDTEGKYYVLVHQEDWNKTTTRRDKWSHFDFDMLFDIDVRDKRKRKLLKIVGTI